MTVRLGEEADDRVDCRTYGHRTRQKYLCENLRLGRLVLDTRSSTVRWWEVSPLCGPLMQPLVVGAGPRASRRPAGSIGVQLSCYAGIHDAEDDGFRARQRTPAALPAPSLRGPCKTPQAPRGLVFTSSWHGRPARGAARRSVVYLRAAGALGHRCQVDAPKVKIYKIVCRSARPLLVVQTQR